MSEQRLPKGMKVNTFQVRQTYGVNLLTNQIRGIDKKKHRTEPKPRLGYQDGSGNDVVVWFVCISV